MKPIVVIGGVAAGMSAASQAKRRSPGTEVIVLEQGRDVSYGACGMPYNLADPERDIEDLVVISAPTFREKRRIDVRLEHRVNSIDRERHRVLGESPAGEFEIEYEKLIIATGARVIRPDLPGIDLPGVHSLHTLEHARALKRALSDPGTVEVVVAGAGYVALEMAEGLVGLGRRVTLTKRKPRLAPWMPEALELRLREQLDANGVEVISGAPLEGFEMGSDRRLRVLAGGRRLPADLALVALGVRPNSEVAAAAGLELGPGGAVAVDDRLLTSDPDIYAAGDCADAFHRVTGARTWIPLALRANRAGKIAGANAIGADLRAPPVAGTMAFRLFELEVARSGLSGDEATAAGFDPVSSLIHASTRAHAFPGAGRMSVELVADRGTGRLVGGQIVAEEGAAHRIDTIAAALAASMTAEDLAGLDLVYSPPFGPTWDPLLVAATQLVKVVDSGSPQ